jgi:hypothetical protein
MPRPNPDTIGLWIEAVNTEGRNLTAWERSFMASIADQFDRTGSLSERQIEILERIYAERTP